MKRILISVFICMCLVLCSCSRADNDGLSSKQQNTSQPTVSDASENVVLQERFEEEKYDDLFPSINDCAKDIQVYRNLTDDKYADAVARLEQILDGYSREISLTVYSLDNSKALCYNTQSRMFCACTVKAAYCLYCFEQIEKRGISLDTEMVYEQKHYESGTGDIQYSSFGSVYPMKTVIDKCMGISDNAAYLMLVDYFGSEGYNSWITALGCESLKIKPTVWSLNASSKELALIWREIYEYFNTENEYSKAFFDSCTNTAGNYATAALGDVDYSHKQGHNYSGDWHAYSDAGIVWKEDSPYIISILTNAPGPSSYDAAVMADIINIVHYELF